MIPADIESDGVFGAHAEVQQRAASTQHSVTSRPDNAMAFAILLIESNYPYLSINSARLLRPRPQFRVVTCLHKPSPSPSPLAF